MKRIWSLIITCGLLVSTFAISAEDEDMYIAVIPEGDKVSIISRMPSAMEDDAAHLATVPESQDTTKVSIAPSDCAECAKGCLEPPMTWTDSKNSAYSGGLINITADQPTKCIRSDGFDFAEDVAILLGVTNDTDNDFFVRVLESGTLIYERYVLAQESVGEELIPSADRRYTYSISVDPDSARQFPIKVGYSGHRGENGQKLMMSLIQIRIGVEG